MFFPPYSYNPNTPDAFQERVMMISSLSLSIYIEMNVLGVCGEHTKVNFLSFENLTFFLVEHLKKKKKNWNETNVRIIV